MGAARDGRLALRGWAGTFDPVRVAVFLVTFVCGTAIAYSFMLLLTSLSVWMVRNQSLMEMWWLFTSLMRYPKEIFQGTLGRADRAFLHLRRCRSCWSSTSRPRVMVRVLDPRMVGFTLAATAALRLGRAGGSSSTRCGPTAARAVEPSP